MLNFTVTLCNLVLVELEQFYSLPQTKKMLLPVVPDQRFRDACFTIVAPTITKCGQFLRITLSGKHSQNNFHPGDSSDIADYVVQQEVHLSQSFLHMLDMSTGILNQGAALT